MVSYRKCNKEEENKERWCLLIVWVYSEVSFICHCIFTEGYTMNNKQSYSHTQLREFFQSRRKNEEGFETKRRDVNIFLHCLR